MLIADYFRSIEETVSSFPAISSSEISFDQRTHNIGFIKGVLTFRDGSELHFKEFVKVGDETVKYKYAYHYQKEDQLLFRYDNHPIPLKDVPKHHKHHLSEDNIVETNGTDLEDVLKEVITFLST